MLTLFICMFDFKL